MRRKLVGLVTGVAAVGLAAGVAFAGGNGSSGSRMDDGKDLLSKASISEQQAIAAAQTAAKGSLNEVDLEYYEGNLVYNVDVGSHDVKVDAGSGKVVAATQDD